ncbi:MAG: PEGA domain-containing protein [bacterium]|nr:PEGA domain-containing protein [bacterium]
MTKRTRRKLFYLSLIIFVFMSIGVLSFASGITYDFENNQLVQTGSIAIKTNVEAQVLIDEEKVGDTALLSHNFSRRNMLPGEYNVQIKKEGFQSWQKQVEVTEGLVSDFSKIVLVREIPEEEVLDKGIQMIFPSPDDRRLAFVQKEQLVIFDLFSRNVIYTTPLSGLSAAKLKLVWESRGEKILVHDGLSALLIDPVAEKGSLLTFLPRYFLNEQTVLEGQKIYGTRIQKGKNILESFDVATSETDLVIEDLYAFDFVDTSLFFVSNFDQRLYRLRLETNSLEQFPVIDRLPVAGSIRQLEERDRVVYTLIGDRLYKIDQADSLLIGDKVVKFSFSPDNGLLGWITGHEAWTLATKDNLYQPQRRVGEREMLTRFSGTLEDLTWHQNGAHLILKFNTGASLLAEIDLRGGSNQYNLLQGSLGNRWQYNQTLNKIVQWKNGNLVLVSY